MREYLREHLLIVLRDMDGYSANDAILTDLVRARGIVNSVDVVRTELAWLEEQGLVTVERFDELAVATITRRGVDVANGAARVPGVHRPLPGGD